MPPIAPAIIASQLEAGLCMFDECVRACPDEHWDSPIAKYPFWLVAYHTLCYVDCYLSRGSAVFSPRPDLHPKGMQEYEEEYPSRRFERDELVRYIGICRAKVRTELEADDDVSLASPSGFSWLPFTRAELHLYNLRHLSHHTGQLTAFLRRVGVETGWVKMGWKERRTS